MTEALTTKSSIENLGDQGPEFSRRFGRQYEPVPIAADGRSVFPHDLRMNWVEIIVHPLG
jgi:hypothetical protein